LCCVIYVIGTNVVSFRTDTQTVAASRRLLKILRQHWNWIQTIRMHASTWERLWLLWEEGECFVFRGRHVCLKNEIDSECLFPHFLYSPCKFLCTLGSFTGRNSWLLSLDF